MIQCPDCETEAPEIRLVRDEIVRVTYATWAQETARGAEVIMAEEVESETVDADRDGAQYRCDDCGYETEDPDDFLSDDNDEEEL